LDSIKPISPQPNVYSPSYKDLPVNSPVYAVSQFSDWHTGEVQEEDEVEGFNAFSPEIQDKRLADLDKITLNWVDYHRKVYRVDNHVIIVTGDLISGDIHEELRVTNAYPMPVQVHEAAKKLAVSIGSRASHFKKITVHFLVEDNHSRLTKKPQHKESGMNSMNYLVGIMTQQYLSKYENIEFNVYPVHEKVISVNGMQYLISHGHDIKGWMGIPWYSIERKLGRETKARFQIIMSQKEEELRRLREIGFNKYLFGHWHTNFDHDIYACSSSLSGTTAFDHASGRYSVPGQPIWMVHPKWGEFDRTNVKLNIQHEWKS
jgi:hypothetical protein